MIFISLIVVGYTSIVVKDQQQVIDNDLSASAIAAAQAGVEDGKRFILYCDNNPSAAGCDTVLNGSDCNTFNNANAKSCYNS